MGKIIPEFCLLYLLTNLKCILEPTIIGKVQLYMYKSNVILSPIEELT